MSTVAQPASSDISDREVVISRVLDAPRELVWKVWTESDHIARWWGPNGFRTTTSSMDVRAGGVWRFVMHGPDGTDYQNKIVYREVTPPSRLQYEHTGDEGEPVAFQVSVTLEPEGKGTRITMRMLFPTAEELRRVNERYGAIEGAHQTVARMAAYLATLT